MFAPSSSIEYIKAGKLRALAVTTAMRSETLPDMPTVGEFVPGYEASLLVRHRRAQEHAGRDHRQAQQGDQCRPRRSRRLRRGLPTWAARHFAGSPAEFGKLIAEETEKWAKVIKFAGIKPE